MGNVGGSRGWRVPCGLAPCGSACMQHRPCTSMQACVQALPARLHDESCHVQYCSAGGNAEQQVSSDAARDTLLAARTRFLPITGKEWTC